MRKTVSFITAGCTAALLAGCASPDGPSAAAGAAITTGSATAPSSADIAASPSTPAASAGKSSAATPAHAAPTHATASAPPATHPIPGAAPTSFGYSPTADNAALIDAARKAAAADGREVLLDFGASWCGNCVAMDHDFRTPQVQSVLASSYHLVQIDVDHDGGTLMRYDKSGSYALPVLIVLSPSGTMRVDTNKTGNPGFDVSGFLAFLKRWAE